MRNSRLHPKHRQTADDAWDGRLNQRRLASNHRQVNSLTLTASRSAAALLSAAALALHKETGLVLKKANKFHIRKAIKLLIDDYVLRKKFSLAGRKRIENFDWLLLSRAIVSKISSEV